MIVFPLGMPSEKEELILKSLPLGQCQFPINKDNFVPLEEIIGNCNLSEANMEQR